MPQKPSYKCNKHYSKHFNLSYELKRDAYNCYLRARENPALGYMKGLNHIEMKYTQSLVF